MTLTPPPPARRLPRPQGGAVPPAPTRRAPVAKLSPASTSGAALPRSPWWRAPWGRIHVRLLPATMFAAVLLLGVRVADVWWTLTAGRALPEMAAAQAQSNTPSTNAPPPVNAPQANAPQAVAPAGGKAPAPSPVAPTAPVKAGGPRPAGDHAAGEPSGSPSDGTFTPKDMELLQRLAERREQLDQREKDLDQREAMLQVATQHLDQKLAEMQDLRKQLEGMVNQVNADQAAQIDSLVKIYEAMKPADAARIFETMDDKVLINVVSRMKEGKTALVLAALSPKRAEQITMMLVERKRLPVNATAATTP